MKDVKARRVFVVEDLPNMAHKASIHQVLESYINSSAAYPLVLIISEIQATDKNDKSVSLRQFCPSSVLSYAHQIIFNPIAKTILTKAINSLSDKEFRGARRKNRPSKGSIEGIVDSCNGDVFSI
jgi:Rad17 P-loop domain